MEWNQFVWVVLRPDGQLQYAISNFFEAEPTETPPTLPNLNKIVTYDGLIYLTFDISPVLVKRYRKLEYEKNRSYSDIYNEYFFIWLTSEGEVWSDQRGGNEQDPDFVIQINYIPWNRYLDRLIDSIF